MAAALEAAMAQAVTDALAEGISTSAVNAATLRSRILAARQSAWASFYPVAGISLAIFGDSSSDEYRANDARGGTFGATTFNWAELLVLLRSVNLGTWGTRTEPRRTGYAQNWARSGEVMGEVHNGGASSAIIAGQHTGIAAQVTSGAVDTVWMQIGGNDFTRFNGTYAAIYNNTLTDQQVTDKIDSMLANFDTAIAAIHAAGPARFVVCNVHDNGPAWTGFFPNATQRARVTSAINSLNSQLAPIVAGYSGVALYNRNGWYSALVAAYPPNGSGQMSVGGHLIETVGDGDDPHYLVLGDGNHFGTVANGIYANMSFIAMMNDSYGLGLASLSEAEIVTAAGL